ncbi:YlbF family regulator [Lachnospiraceae bacterium]|nr:YlbF family regulator [Lachnospiraceae bacterium]
MTDGHLNKIIMDFVRAIKGSQEFSDYKELLERIKGQPELYDKANAFRQKNFAIQSSESGERLIECLEELEREFEDVRAIPLVDEFLAAELCFCKMMQEINELIWEEIDFQ